MEAFIHNLNTVNSRAGGHVPLSSVCFGTDTTPEGRMVSKNFLEALAAGIGNHETAQFPISIFKIKEGINYKPEDTNYDIFERACEVSLERNILSFEFLDSSFNKTIKESKYWQKCIIDDVLFLRSFCLHKDSHLLDPSLLDILKNVLSGKPISLLFGRVDESMLNRYDDINHNTSLYLENNFCCYIELLRYIKNIMSEEIYILEINDIKYLIFKNNYN